MRLIAVLLVLFGWIAVWGLFDIYTDKKTENEKIKIYISMISIIIISILICPKLIDLVC